MSDRGINRAAAVQQIAAVLAGAYLRLRCADPPPNQVDCPETKSESCDGRLTP